MASLCCRSTERRRAANGCLPSCLWLLLALLSVYAANAADDTENRSRLEALGRQIGDLRQGLTTDRKHYSELQSQLAGVEKRLASLSRTNDEMRQDLGRQRQSLARLGLRRDALEERLAAQKKVLRRQFRGRFLISRQGGPLRLILADSGSIPRGRLMVYYDYIQQGIRDKLLAAEQTRDRLSRVENELLDRQARIQTLLADQELMLVDEQQKKNQRQQLLAQLNAAIAGKQATLEHALNDQHRLQKLLDGLQQGEQTEIFSEPLEKPAYTRQKTRQKRVFSEQKKALPWPLRGKVVAHFGRRRTKLGLRWRGVMIASPAGNAVHAVFAGKVVFADWFRGFGLLMIVDHGQGYMTLYGHNQRLDKRSGEQVAQGETIARVGSSGGMSRSALYFELRFQGRPQDPLRWFVRRG